MKYALSVEVKLQEIPEQEIIPDSRPGDDPMAMLGPAIKIMAGTVARPAFFMGSQAGFDFRKAITVAAPNFQGLADIIGKFDSLVSEIELDRL